MSEETTGRCTAWTAKGMQCSHTRALVDGLCRFHNPACREAMTAMRRKGQAAAVAARQESRKVRLALASQDAGPRPPVGNSLEEIGTWLKWCLESAARGAVSLGELTAFTTTARALQVTYEKRDLEQRLRTLQRSYEALKRKLERAR